MGPKSGHKRLVVYIQRPLIRVQTDTATKRSGAHSKSGNWQAIRNGILDYNKTQNFVPFPHSRSHSKPQKTLSSPFDSNVFLGLQKMHLHQPIFSKTHMPNLLSIFFFFFFISTFFSFSPKMAMQGLHFLEPLQELELRGLWH